MSRPVTASSVAWRALACLAIALPCARAATFDVNNTGDFGFGTLREAIINANKNPGPDVITFSIPGSGEQVIKLASELPAITDTVLIEGYSQPGAKRNTLNEGFDAVINIFVDGAAIPPNGNPVYTQMYGLTFRKGAEGSRLSGAKLANFTYAVVLANVDSVTIEGSKLLDNRDAQVLVTGNGNAIGLRGAGTRNLIAGQAEGIVLAGDGNVVKNNYIGFAESITDGVSVNAASNGVVGFFGKIGVMYSSPVVNGPDLICDKFVCGLAFQSNHHQIGGREGGEGNIIIGQGLGGVITKGASNGNRQNAVMRVEGNRFGASFDGARRPGFGNFYGVFLNHSGASINIIEANSIYDGQAGIVVDGGKGKAPITGAKLTQNRIVGQSRMAIDLGDNNRDLNDRLDPDGGNNNTQNYPWAFGAPSGSSWRLSSAPSETFTLEFFQSGGACKNPEADVYLGAYSVTTDAAGEATFSGLNTLPGGFITATATDKTGNTSELSDCIAAAKLKSKVAIVSWNTPLLSGTWNSRYEMQVYGGGGLFNPPTGSVDLWSIEPSGGRRWFGSAPLNGNTALWDQFPSGFAPRTLRVQADYSGDAVYGPSTSNIVDVVIYDIKHTFKSGTSDMLRAAFVNNAPVPGSYEILAGSDIAAGMTGNWTALGLASGKRVVAAGKFVYGWNRSTFLASDSAGNMTLEYFNNGALTTLPITGWQPGNVVEVGRFFRSDQQGVVVERSPKRFEVRLLPDEFLSQLPVVQTDPLRNEAANPLITSLSIAAVGDFDGDGNDDIIWDVDGGLEMWLMDGSARAASTILVSPPITFAGGAPVAFSIAAVGDFDGDGRTDILWRGGDYYYVALMNGGSLKEAVASITVNTVPAEWKIKVVADYDGDGKADLLWRNEGSTPGVNVIYYMNGSSQPPGSRIVPVQAFALTMDFVDP